MRKIKSSYRKLKTSIKTINETATMHEGNLLVSSLPSPEEAFSVYPRRKRAKPNFSKGLVGMLDSHQTQRNGSTPVRRQVLSLQEAFREFMDRIWLPISRNSNVDETPPSLLSLASFAVGQLIATLDSQDSNTDFDEELYDFLPVHVRRHFLVSHMVATITRMVEVRQVIPNLIEICVGCNAPQQAFELLKHFWILTSDPLMTEFACMRREADRLHKSQSWLAFLTTNALSNSNSAEIVEYYTQVDLQMLPMFINTFVGLAANEVGLTKSGYEMLLKLYKWMSLNSWTISAPIYRRIDDIIASHYSLYPTSMPEVVFAHYLNKPDCCFQILQSVFPFIATLAQDISTGLVDPRRILSAIKQNLTPQCITMLTETMNALIQTEATKQEKDLYTEFENALNELQPEGSSIDSLMTQWRFEPLVGSWIPATPKPPQHKFAVPKAVNRQTPRCIDEFDPLTAPTTIERARRAYIERRKAEALQSPQSVISRLATPSKTWTRSYDLSSPLTQMNKMQQPNNDIDDLLF